MLPNSASQPLGGTSYVVVVVKHTKSYETLLVASVYKTYLLILGITHGVEYYHRSRVVVFVVHSSMYPGPKPT